MDNSGARRVRCIKVYKKPGRGCGQAGDLLQVLILRLRNRGFIRVKVGQMHFGLLTRSSKNVLRMKSGSFFKFDENTVIVLSKKKLPTGTRLFGPCAKEMRKSKLARVLSLSTRLL